MAHCTQEAGRIVDKKIAGVRARIDALSAEFGDLRAAIGRHRSHLDRIALMLSELEEAEAAKDRVTAGE